MTRNEALDYARGRMAEYLMGKGINTGKPFRCLNPEHEDRNPSMRYDRKRGKIKCFSCNVDWDIFDLVGAEYGIRVEKEKFDKTYELLGIRIDREQRTETNQPIASKPANAEQKAVYHAKAKQQTKEKLKPPIAPFLEACQASHEETTYLKNRGISFETAKRFGLGFSQNKNADYNVPWPAIIIPTGPESFTARNTNPEAEKNDRIRKFGPSEIFNFEATQGGEPVFITEGEFDMLAVEEVGYRAISLGSAANINKFINLLKDNPPKCPGFILLMDNDDEGKAATHKLEKELDKLGILSMGPSDGAILGEYKDPNAFLVGCWDDFRCTMADYVSLAPSVFDRKRNELFGDNAAAHIEAFKEGISASASTEAISSGFRQLDFHLDGGFHEGLYVLGAITSLGKTTLALQLGDQIAQGGTDVLIFSLEMSRPELMAKSVSRLTFVHCSGQKQNAKTVRGILSGKRYEGYSDTEKGLINYAVEEYRKYADYIYISMGQGDIGVAQIRERINKHLNLTNRRPFVIIDYLQILAPYDPRSTDKQNTDKAVLELKRISRDFKIPVLAISSFNRENYANAVSLVAFKESGAIEYSADVIIGLQIYGMGDKENKIDIDAEKQADPRRIELKILKNRNGPTGGVVDYAYYPKFNFYEEV